MLTTFIGLRDEMVRSLIYTHATSATISAAIGLALVVIAYRIYLWFKEHYEYEKELMIAIPLIVTFFALLFFGLALNDVVELVRAITLPNAALIESLRK